VQPHGEPARRARGALTIAALEENLMRPLPETLALVVPPHEVRRRCKPFDVFRLQGNLKIGRLKQAIGLRPGLLLECLPCALVQSQAHPALPEW
jgi:hypothetical protein